MKNILLIFAVILIQCSHKESNRKVISLNGTWQIEESLAGNVVPGQFNHQIEVPGIVDMASPALFGTNVYLNGKEVGFSTWCFTPSVFDLKPYLNEPGKYQLSAMLLYENDY